MQSTLCIILNQVENVGLGRHCFIGHLTKGRKYTNSIRLFEQFSKTKNMQSREGVTHDAQAFHLQFFFVFLARQVAQKSAPQISAFHKEQHHCRIKPFFLPLSQRSPAQPPLQTHSLFTQAAPF